MDSKYETSKRRKTTLTEGEDRLSSRPDAILIEIVSFLPLCSAVTTEVLSTRWRGLWTRVTSIHIDNPKFNDCYFDHCLFSTFDQIIRRITSPFFDTFTLNLHTQTPNGRKFWLDILDSWLRRVCSSRILHLKLTYAMNPICSRYVRSVFPVPSLVFRSRLLVSIELGLEFGWSLPDGGGSIDLPNLVSLKVSVRSYNNRLKELIEGCPLFEELSFTNAITAPKLEFETIGDELRSVCFDSRWTSHRKFAIS